MRVCKVCAHERRHQIEIGMVHQVPFRTLGARFGLKPSTLYRHAKLHLPPQTRAAILAAQKPSEVDLEQLQRNEAEGLLSQLVTQRARLHQQAGLAAELGDVRGAVAVERAIIANLELVGRLLSQFTVHHEVTHRSVLVSADYLQLRSALLTALRPHPAAMRDVAAALHQLESAAAANITDAKAPLVLEHQSIANGKDIA
jgi:hypothetical protein